VITSDDGGDDDDAGDDHDEVDEDKTRYESIVEM
jgi:hypothetical protein